MLQTRVKHIVLIFNPLQSHGATATTAIAPSTTATNTNYSLHNT